MKRIQMRTICFSGALLLLAANNPAGAGGIAHNKAWVVDTLRPNGRARGQAEKLADGATCNNLARSGAPYDQGAYDGILDKCMSDHGRRIVRTETAPVKPSYATNGEQTKILTDDADLNFQISHSQ